MIKFILVFASWEEITLTEDVKTEQKEAFIDNSIQQPL